MKKLTIQIVLIICSFQLQATTYYLSGKGNDSQTGLNQSESWLTINRLNQVQLQPGDSVFFQCGSVFCGQINLKSSGSEEKKIYFSSYDKGVPPIISGGNKVNEWEKYGDNVWRALINYGKVMQLFEGTKRLSVGRHPNSGFFYADMPGSKTSFKDSDLKGASGFYNGANVVIRNSDFHWENKMIKSIDDQGNVTLSSAVNNVIDSGQGFFVLGKISFVDQQDEWCFDETSGYLYLFSNTNPSGRNLFASIYEYGIKGDWNINNISISNITFSEQATDGIWLRGAGCTNNSISNCRFFGQRSYGLSVMGNNLIIQNNHFENIGGLGLEGYGIDQILIENNSFKKIGTTPGISVAGVGDMQAIRLWNTKNASVLLNSIDSTGYSGMTFNVEIGTIEKNLVTNSLLSTSDGSALYCFGKETKNITIKNNIANQIIGNLDGRPTTNQLIKLAFYLDNYVENCIVKNNTCIGAGILSNAGTSNNSFIGNTVYKSPVGITISDWYAGSSIFNIKLDGNIFFTNVVAGIPVIVQSDNNNFNVFSNSNNNHFYNPYEDKVIAYEWSQSNTFTLSEWITKTGFDKNSFQCPFRWDYGVDQSFILINKTKEPITYRFENPVLDIDNKSMTTITLDPFSSKIFIGKNSLVTQMEDLSSVRKLISTYPNPANDILNIQSEYPIEKIIIFDTLGNLIYQCNHLVSNALDISSLKPGLYILVADISGKKINEKIIII